MKSRQSVFIAALLAAGVGLLLAGPCDRDIKAAPDGRLSSLGLPDFTVNGAAAASSIRITEDFFGPQDCARVEQCLNGPGQRKLLRFDTVIENRGTADMELGAPAENPLFEFSACHGHYHLYDMMIYELLDPVTGEQVVTGRKQGFCMMDKISIEGVTGVRGKYDCNVQGLSAGWADSYDSDLDCQWIDVTDIAPGAYLLRMTVNPKGIFSESDTSNNSATVLVSVD